MDLRLLQDFSLNLFLQNLNRLLFTHSMIKFVLHFLIFRSDRHRIINHAFTNRKNTIQSID